MLPPSNGGTMSRIKLITIALVVAIVYALVPIQILADDPPVLEITAPSGPDSGPIDLGSLIGTDDATRTSTIDGTVTCTEANGYTLKINSNNTNGKMAYSGTELNAPLLVSATLIPASGAAITTGGTLTNATITTTKQEIGETSEAGPGGANIFSISLKQAQQAVAPVGTYNITLTFTLTANLPP